MSGSFSIALSGLTADTDALDIVGNNLANLNTTGYKDTTASFYDLLAQTAGGGAIQIGGGVSATIGQSQFTQGSIQLTGGAFDGAIQGNGFFVVRDTNGDTLYTRAGNFQLDGTGTLVTATGQDVQGWAAVNGAVNTSGAVGNIVIPADALSTPKPTTEFSANLNLQSNATVGSTAATFNAPIQVVDSLGATHTLTVTFTETAANTWGYSITIPGQDLTGGTAGTPSQVATGTLNFDSNGNLKTPAPPGQVAVAITGLADGAGNMNLNWNLYNPTTGASTITQFDQPSALAGTSQDGAPSTEITQVSLAAGGAIVAHYSDGSQATIAQVALAAISNPQSLISTGQNNFELGSDTAAPAVGSPGTGSRGTIQGGALESSNVDIATEFTNLIVYQRSYEANSRVISTLDQLTQDLLNLKQ
ncbi:MAG TPA: flagellar hook protein FlgE [Bryobacteraceae bacterium]|jgi:flagellar hook protein FlgE|nr:flagellar hook protein FlgE [Bryobacteraceae bacterium]